jgi:serine phosphatase RsbU (regulator of sigma subunit)
MILLFTDGITELGFESKNMYGQERLEAAFLKNANLPLQEIVNNLIKDATSHHSKQEDDITVAVIRKV